MLLMIPPVNKTKSKQTNRQKQQKDKSVMDGLFKGVDSFFFFLVLAGYLNGLVWEFLVNTDATDVTNCYFLLYCFNLLKQLILVTKTKIIKHHYHYLK